MRTAIAHRRPITTPPHVSPAAPPLVPAPPVAPVTPVVEVVVQSGPAVDAPVALAPGRHVVGRAPGAAVYLADRSVEPHHALLAVADDGSIEVVQLAGRTPLLVDGRPLGPGSPAGRRLRAGSTLTVGSSQLRVAPPATPTPPVRTGDVPGDTPARPAQARRMVVREPRAVPVLAVAAIEPPAEPPRVATASSHPGMLVGALAGVTGGLVMALVTGSVLALVFGIVASVASFATWLVHRVRHVRDHRRRRDHQRAAAAAFAESVADAATRIRTHHEATVPGLARRLAGIGGNELWSRRSTHGDAFTLTLGRGDLEWPVPLADGVALAPDLLAITETAGVLTDVEVPVRLDTTERTVVAVDGVGSDAVVRGLVVQLAISTGPADWCVRAVVSDPAQYAWIDRLPHAVGGEERSVVDAADAAAVGALARHLDDGDSRRVVVVCDVPALLATRTGPLRRLLDGGRPVTVLLAVTDGSGLPAVCDAVLRMGSAGTGHWTPDLHDGAAAAAWGGVRVRPVGVRRAVAERVADRLSHYLDPEDPSTSTGRLPRTLRLGELPGAPHSVEEVLERWNAGGVDPAPAAIVGTSVDGVIELDLVRDGPHALVAGTTGSGKSELLRTWVVQLAANVAPRHLSLVLVDYKGGSTFDACADLPHTVGVVTDLDEGLAGRALTSLEAELHRRERILREHGAADLAAYRAVPGVAALPRLVVVIDEFAAMAKELPEFLAALVGIAQRGRSLGIHLVLATQRPAGVVDDAVRANTNLRMALRLHDASDAVDVVGDRAPASFPRGIPGRAVVRLGPDEVVEFQAASCSTPGGVGDAGPSELARVVAFVREAALANGFAGSHRPWLPSLDELVRRGGEHPEPGSIGWIDDPAAQARRALMWDRTGNLALVGALGSGTTTTLVALAGALAGDGGADAPTIHVIDGCGAPALVELDRLPTCTGVIGVGDTERVDRLLGRLGDEIDARRRRGSAAAGGDDPPGHVLIVDGLDVLRRSLDDPARVDASGAPIGPELLHRVLADGPAVGVVTVAVVTTDGPGATAALARFAERWVFHLDDPASGPLLGVPAARIPGEIAGRLLVASSGLEAHVAEPAPLEVSGPRRVAAVGVLPDVVERSTLDVVGDDPPVVGGSVVGRRYDDLDVARFEIGPGDRVVIAGPRRSGRSSLLGLLVAEWRRAHPHGEVTTIGLPADVSDVSDESDVSDMSDMIEVLRRVDEPDGARPLLLAVDDADQVDDPGGDLARLVAATRRGGRSLAIVVAGRADALRAYDHWAADARRDRRGFVLVGTSETDADVLGTAPPRRCPLAPRPGLAWMVADGDCTLVQTALPEPGAVSRG